MPVTVILVDGLGGSYQTVNGSKSDAYRFTKKPAHPRFPHLHTLEFATAAEFNKASQDLLTATGNGKMFVEVTPEIAPEDAALAERAKVADENLALARVEVERLTQEAEAAKLLASQVAKPDADTAALLAERDALLDLLKPHLHGEETPSQVLTRILSRPTKKKGP